MHPSRPRKHRIHFLDWLRGLAAIIMLQGHTFDSFLRLDARNSPAFMLSQFFAGQAAAIFLFLTGITYALGMNRCEHLPRWERVTTALKRARYLFLLAILFRVQMWAFSLPDSHWTDLFRVDALNLMGATAALLSITALRTGLARARLAVLAGIVFAAAAPLISGLDTGSVPLAISGYFVPSAQFSIFPWGSFLAFGLAAGSVIPFVENGGWSRVMQWAALAGFGLVFSGRYFANLPFSIYSNSEFWLNSPALIACKMGVTMLLGAAAFLWTEYFSVGWSWVRQLGTTSLVVYWVHIELTYGRWFKHYRTNLGVWECTAAAALLVLLMIGVSLLVTRVSWRKRYDAFLFRLHSKPLPSEAELERVS
jgi:uncharacterized membrane protein